VYAGASIAGSSNQSHALSGESLCGEPSPWSLASQGAAFKLIRVETTHADVCHFLCLTQNLILIIGLDQE